MNIIVHRKKLRLGFIYGVAAGFAFALFAWGIDAWMLERANDSFFWVKLLPGLILCVIAGGLAGWLTILLQRHGFTLLIWGSVAVFYSWLVVWLPYIEAGRIISFIDPGMTRLFNFSLVLGIGQIRLISLIIIGAVGLIAGLLEINLIDQAVLSPYTSGRVTALAVCVVLFGLAGSATDNFINTPLREPMQAINTMIQFAQDNIGVEVPKATARLMHQSATNQIKGLIQKPRRLTLIAFDENLLTVDILVDFAGTWVKCSTIYSQPTNCAILQTKP